MGKSKQASSRTPLAQLPMQSNSSHVGRHQSRSKSQNRNGDLAPWPTPTQMGQGNPTQPALGRGFIPESLQPSEVLGFTSAAMDLLIKINVFLPYLILHVKLRNALF